MKQAAHFSVALRLAAALLLCASAALGADKQKKHKSAKGLSNAQAGSELSAPSGSGISARTENGQTTIMYKGKQVFNGPATGQVSALSSNENGTEYAAAFDGDKVLWENSSDAAKHLKRKGVDANVSAQDLLNKMQKDLPAGTGAGAGADTGIKVTSENGQTKVYYKGKEVFDGKTSGKVSAKASSENGAEYAAAFDGDKVIWENASGAAGHLK